MSRRPLIGITPTPTISNMAHGRFYQFGLADTYVNAVHAAGGLPVILPSTDGDPAEVLDAVDGLILSGGGDIAPARFGQASHPETSRIDDRRDAFELALMHAAAEQDLPTLAICRGIQVMSVAFGGQIDQHLPDVVSGDIPHRQHDIGLTRDDVSHQVTLENLPNPLSDILGTDALKTNSFHHQALADVPVPLRLAARSADGVIEAVWHPGMSFGIGVQWHPEMLAANHTDHARLFGALVAAARQPSAIAS